METDICLICGSRGRLSASVFFEQLSSEPPRRDYVNFVLGQVLELPSELIEGLTRKYSGDPEELVKVCVDCNESYVRKCREIFAELLEVKSRFRDAKLKVVEAIKRSKVTEKDVTSLELESQERLLLDIYNKIRQFVETHEYGHRETSLLITGDLLIDNLEEALQEDINLDDPLSEEVIPFKNSDAPAHILEEFKTEPLSPASREEEETDDQGAEEESPHEDDSEYSTEAESSSQEDEDWDDDGKLSVPSQKKHVNVKNGNDNPKPEKKRVGRPRIHPIQEKKPKPVFNCDQCSEVFTGQMSLRSHQIVIHKTNLFSCPNCDHKATTSTSLNAHIKRHHNTDKESLNELKCYQCGKILSTIQSLKRHMSSCGNNLRETFQCEHCDRKYLTSFILQNHMGSVHGIKGNLRFKCSFSGCEKYFAKQSLLDLHEATHKPPQFECNLCGEKFIRRLNYRKHMSQHEMGGAKPFQCEKCPSAYTRSDNLLQHVRKMHSSENNEDEAPFSPAIKKQHSHNHKCSECGLIVVWKSKRQLERHIQKVHTGNARIITVDDKGNIFQAPAKAKKVVKNKSPLAFECPTCHKTFPSERSLMYHKREVHKERSATYECEHCDYKCSMKKYYHNHLGIAHGMQEYLQFKCSFEGCGRLFGLKKDLIIHEGRHEPSKKHKCEMCEKVFSNVIYLQSHMQKIHGGSNKEGSRKKRKGSAQEAPVACSICGTLFRNKDHLQTHIANVHEKRYQVCCDMCGRILASRYYLKLHKRKVHNIGSFPIPKFPCTLEGCGRSFQSNRDLKAHTLYKHHGKRLFQCEQCGQHIISANKLKKHVLAMHTNRESKPFKCDECGKGFAIKEYLNLHQKTHQPKKRQEMQQ